MDDDRSVLLVVTFSHSHPHTRTTLILYMKRTTKVITIGIITIGRRVEPNIRMEHWCFYLVPRNRRALGGDTHRFPLRGPKPNMGGVLYGSWDASRTRNDAGI